ncbi:hypothetical protein H8F22_00395 [Pseudomonas sp. P154a]|uniref:hypothetical protein n=1 Tax=Pseudomonas mucoides TaxID=2730424 RepID=UPI00189207D4|nr:hypothetical protein [Pseudomonas mucoides]MBF6037328.1 hypothetical protein [Pseudomonas mucoides]
MSNFTLSSVASAILLAALASGAQAAVETTTSEVKGQAPVVSALTITNKTYPGRQPEVGDELSADYTFADADGDAQSGTVIQWLRGGSNIGTGASTYTTVPADTDQSVSVQVTPQTDPAITDPFTGILVASPAVIVTAEKVDIGDFLTPDDVERTWSAANNYCIGQGARLPTVDELQKLFVNATSSPTFEPNSGYTRNNEMCSNYGWPLSDKCGGRSDDYWAVSKTHTSNGDSAHDQVDMTTGLDGGAFDTDTTVQTVCVR